MMKIIKVANLAGGIEPKQQQECMNAYAFPGAILIAPKEHLAAQDIDKIAIGLGAVKRRVWRRKVEDECKHYLKTSISGSYETAGKSSWRQSFWMTCSGSLISHGSRRRYSSSI